MKRALLILLLSAVGLYGDAFPTARRSGLTGGIWSDAGGPGGIPSIQTVYTNVPLLTLANLSTVVNGNCPSNQVVQLTNGIYDLGGVLLITKDGVIVRGRTNSSGYPITVFTNGAIWIGAKSGWPSDNWANMPSTNVSSGYAPGSTSLTLVNTANSDFAVGDLFILDQAFDGTLVKDSSVEYGCRPDRAYTVTLYCTSKSGSTVGFMPPLLGPYWISGQDPEAFGWTSKVGSTYHTIGLEDVVIEPGSSPELYNAGVGRAYGCWVKNIVTTKWPNSGGSAGLHLRHCVACEVRDSIFHDGPSAVNSSYAVYPVGVSYCSVENCIFTNVPLAMPCATAVGCSFSYNYCVGPIDYSVAGWNPEYFFPHGGHSFMDLWEANWSMAPYYLDQVFAGNNSLLAIVRNRLIGWENGKTANNFPISFNSDMDTNTILGNVLGMVGYHTDYETTTPRIYDIDSSCNGTIKTNNYNTVDSGVHSTEAMSADTMLASYRYSSPPSWWGDRQWPAFPVDSAVTNILYYTNLPAGYRSRYGTWPPAAGGSGGGSQSSRSGPGKQVRRPTRGFAL